MPEGWTVSGLNTKNLLWFVASTIVYSVGRRPCFCFSLMDWATPLPIACHSIPHCWLLSAGFAFPASHSFTTSELCVSVYPEYLFIPFFLEQKEKVKQTTKHDGTDHWFTQSCARPLKMIVKAALWRCFWNAFCPLWLGRAPEYC